MVSVVADRGDKRKVLVRARRQGEIEALLPRAKVQVTPRADYRFRAHVRREAFEGALLRQAKAISYDNFKNSLDDDERHDFYTAVWEVAWRRQGLEASRAEEDRQLAMFDLAWPEEPGDVEDI